MADPGSRRFVQRAQKLLDKSAEDEAGGDLLGALRKAKFAVALDAGSGAAAARKAALMPLYHAQHQQAFVPSSGDSVAATAALQRYLTEPSPDAPLHDPHRTIWFYWHQGIAQAPEVVHRCLHSWRQSNPDHDIVVLDRECLADHIGFDLFAALREFTVALRMPGLSDLIRLLLLSRHGGLWVDASTLCMTPLKGWLPEASAGLGFFCFRHEESEEIFDRRLASWFLFAEPQHPLVTRLLGDAISYLTRDRSERLIEMYHPQLRRVLNGFDLPPKSMDESGANLLDYFERYGFFPYFWMFYLFSDVVKDAGLRPLWAELQTRENAFSKPLDPFEIFLGCKVAKLTQKKEYVASDDGRRRLAWRFGPDFPA